MYGDKLPPLGTFGGPTGDILAGILADPIPGTPVR